MASNSDAGPPPSGRATIRDVAQLAGVHYSTVSRVLNGDDRRAVAETRERIYAAAASLGWRPNTLARSLSLGRAYALGMLIPSFSNPAYAAMIAGAQRAAEDSGNVLLVTDTSDDENRMRVQLERMADRTDGFVVASASMTSPTVGLLTERRIPFVLLNRRSAGDHYSVIGDDERGVGIALDHLVSLGHERIAYIAGPRGFDTVERRVGTFRSYMRDHDLPHGTPLLYRGSLAPARLASAVDSMLSRPPGERPTALLGINLLTAAQLLSILRARGTHVPEHVSVMGFDDWPLAEFLWRPLTTIRMPHEAMGRRSVEKLLQLLAGEDVPRETRVDQAPELVVRESTAAVAASRSTRRSRSAVSR